MGQVTSKQQADEFARRSKKLDNEAVLEDANDN